MLVCADRTTDRVSQEGDEISRVRLFVSTLSVEPTTDLWPWFLHVITIACRKLKIKVINQGSRSVQKCVCSASIHCGLLLIVVVVGFHCDVISCDLAWRGVQLACQLAIPREAARDDWEYKRGQCRPTRSVWRRSSVDVNILVAFTGRWLLKSSCLSVCPSVCLSACASLGTATSWLVDLGRDEDAVLIHA